MASKDKITGVQKIHQKDVAKAVSKNEQMLITKLTTFLRSYLRTMF